MTLKKTQPMVNKHKKIKNTTKAKNNNKIKKKNTIIILL